MLEKCADITDALWTSLVTVEGTRNNFGDTQLSVDVSAARPVCLAGRCSRRANSFDCWFTARRLACFIHSKTPPATAHPRLMWETYRTSPVIHEGTSEEDPVVRGTASSSSTGTPWGSFIGCQLADGSFYPWVVSRTDTNIAEDSRIFSPANLRAAQEVPGYERLVGHYLWERYNLRYSGPLRAGVWGED